MDTIENRLRTKLDMSEADKFGKRELKIIAHYEAEFVKGRFSLNTAADRALDNVKGLNTHDGAPVGTLRSLLGRQ